MSKRLLKSYSIVLAVVIVLVAVLGVALYQPSIHTTTIEELTEINGIGDYYAQSIVTYLENNPDCSIEDLDDIKYIGDSVLSKLRKRYRWLK